MSAIEIAPSVPEVSLDKFKDAELLEVPEPAQKLLEEYSKIPADLVLPHVINVREAAWKIFPYPCIGHFRFLDLGLSKNPAYAEVLERLKKGQQFLDVGCCVGQELRQLVSEGVPSENLYATDIHPEFFEIGFELFQDRETLNSLFLPADLLAKETFLSQLNGKIDIIWTGNFLHLFPWETQVKAVKAMMKLLKPSPYSLIVGRLIGSNNAGEYSHDQLPEKSSYRHNVKSFKKMFHEAGDALGEKWQTDVSAEPFVDSFKISKAQETKQEDASVITFVARKLERLDAAASHNFVF